MMRSYLISYDVTDDKRLRRIYKKMRGFGDRLQYSIFYCQLSELQLAVLTGDILEIINEKEDRVMIVDLGDNEKRVRDRVEFLGLKDEFPERTAIIV